MPGGCAPGCTFTYEDYEYSVGPDGPCLGSDGYICCEPESGGELACTPEPECKGASAIPGQTNTCTAEESCTFINDGTENKNGACCNRDGKSACTWCDECDYPQIVKKECCENPHGPVARGEVCDDSNPFCCKCGYDYENSYHCVASPAECKPCLETCGSGELGLCTPYCRNACPSVLESRCGCKFANPNDWDDFNMICGGTSGGCTEDGASCCGLKISCDEVKEVFPGLCVM